VRSQDLDRVNLFRQVLLAEEHMNYAVTDGLQAYDREGLGVDFTALRPSMLLRVEVMSTDLAVEWAAAEEAYHHWLVRPSALSPFHPD
jgi:hypothetical protein